MYYLVSIPFAGRSPELLCERLADFAVEGIEEHSDSLSVFFGSLAEATQAGLALGGGAAEEIADRNWSAAWQADWVPLSIGKRFFLCPAWDTEATPAGRIRLEMVPGNVFGGGDHATTQLCLELLEEVVVPGALVADIGAGTGVLTRAARALGARAVGCDIDRASSIDFIGSADALAGGRFDGVIANIHLGVLRELADELRRLLRPGGWLLVGGFLPEQAGEVEALLGPFVEMRERDGWCAAVIAVNTIPLHPERQQELEKFAQDHGQTPAAALDEAVASYLEWRSRDFEEAVEGIRQGYEDVKAGRTRPAAEFFADMRRKYDFPR